MSKLTNDNRFYCGTATLAGLSWYALLIDLGVGASLASLLNIFNIGFNAGTSFGFIALLIVLIWSWNRLKWHAVYAPKEESRLQVIRFLILFMLLILSVSPYIHLGGMPILPVLCVLALLVLLMLLWVGLVTYSGSSLTLYKSHYISYLVAFILVFTSVWTGPVLRILLWGCAILSVLVIPFIVREVGSYPPPERAENVVWSHISLITALCGFILLLLLDSAKLKILSGLPFFFEVFAVIILLWKSMLYTVPTDERSAATSIHLDTALHAIYIPLMLFFIGIKYGLPKLLTGISSFQPWQMFAVIAGAGGVMLVQGFIMLLFEVRSRRGALVRLAGGVILFALIPLISYLSFATIIHLSLFALIAIALSDLHYKSKQ